MSVLEPAERFALYVDSFASEYGTLQRMALEEDIVTALEDMGVEDNGDFERLHVAWDDLRNQVKRGSAGEVQAAAPAPSAHPKPRVPHPAEDVDALLSSLDFDISTLRPATPPAKVKKVLLTGVTGFVGRVQLAALLQSRQRPDLHVYCLVRARDPDHALSRIQEACKEAKCWQDSFVARITAIPGDFTQPSLGLSSQEFEELARSVDIVYHTGGDVNLLSNYGRLRATNVLSVKTVIELCTTYRIKPLHFASTLGQFPAFFAMFAGSFSTQTITEDSTPDVQQMENFYLPSRQGYPWSKWAAERVLEGARKRGLPVAIYRLPNTYIAYKTGYTNKTDYATALMIASIQEGIFPVGAATAPLTPVDTICDMLVRTRNLECNHVEPSCGRSVVSRASPGSGAIPCSQVVISKTAVSLLLALGRAYAMVARRHWASANTLHRLSIFFPRRRASTEAGQPSVDVNIATRVTLKWLVREERRLPASSASSLALRCAPRFKRLSWRSQKTGSTTCSTHAWC